MNILLTGCHGFVGQSLSKLLLDEGNTVIGVDRVDVNGCGFPVVKCDLAEHIPLEPQHFDVVIHCAAAKGDWNLSDREFYRDNVIATKNLLAFLERCTINKLIHFSTVAIYSRETESGDEGTPLQPDSVYGETKLDSEVLVRKFAEQSKVATTILRPSVIYGRDNFANMYNLIKQLSRGLPFQINPAGIVKSHVSVKNVVDVVNRFVKSASQAEIIEIYNLTERPYLNLNQLIAILCDELKTPIPKMVLPLWLVSIPFAILEFVGKIIGKDIGFTRERLQKFSSSTNYTSERLWSTLGAQKHESEQELRDMVQWFKTTKG